MGDESPLARTWSATTPPRTWYGCAARSRRSTRWPGSAPSGCGRLLHTEDFVHSLGAVTGNQAVQQVRAGLPAIYLSGWQVAADANLAGQTYPDQSLYPANSVPQVVRRINNALLRADQITWAEGDGGGAALAGAHRGRRRGRASAACSTRSS